MDSIAEVPSCNLRPRACRTARRRSLRQRRADDIEFRIVGHEMQFVEIELDPGESAIAEAGALMFKDATVQMDTVFGAANGDQGGGFMGRWPPARVLTGESLFATVYTQSGHGKGKVAFAAPYPGTVLAMKLTSTAYA